jgi:hypothetical protein
LLASDSPSRFASRGCVTSRLRRQAWLRLQVRMSLVSGVGSQEFATTSSGPAIYQSDIIFSLQPERDCARQ